MKRMCFTWRYSIFPRCSAAFGQQLPQESPAHMGRKKVNKKQVAALKREAAKRGDAIDVVVQSDKTALDDSDFLPSSDSEELSESELLSQPLNVGQDGKKLEMLN